jgi:hypothetical protein
MMFGKNLGSAKVAALIPVGSVGVEIGVWRGDSTALFLEKAQHVHCVDPWAVAAYEDSDEFGDYQAYLSRYSRLVGSSDPLEFQKYYDRVHREVCDRFPSELVTVHRCTSRYFFTKFCHKVDWVYVDGSHSLRGCSADLHGAKGILKPGGVIYGDDYGNKVGVTAAVSLFTQAHRHSFRELGSNQYMIAV